MVEIRGRLPHITNFERGMANIKFDRGDDIEIRVDPMGTALSTKEKFYINTGTEILVWNGDPVFFDGGIKFSVVDVLETHFVVRAKEEGIVYKNSSMMIPEKHGKLTIIRDEDIKDLENIQNMHRIDFVMIPYVLSKDDVKEIKRRLSFLDKSVIISWLDDKRSFEDFWEITNESGGIYLNRSSLQHSISPEKLF